MSSQTPNHDLYGLDPVAGPSDPGLTSEDFSEGIPEDLRVQLSRTFAERVNRLATFIHVNAPGPILCPEVKAHLRDGLRPLSSRHG